MTQESAISSKEWCDRLPLLKKIIAYRETIWLNPQPDGNTARLRKANLTMDAILDARKRLQRYRGYISKVFPETRKNKGMIESPLRPIPEMQKELGSRAGYNLEGRLFLKCDNLLPISGSIKARGGIYEVLKYAERTAVSHGLLNEGDNYAILAGQRARTLFADHKISVGSTGNLGLSIGIIGAKLGFSVNVHMSADSREWKKKLLRQLGVIVIEHQTDYSQAVAAGRRQAKNDANCYFVDDENSTDLFLGYAVAALELQKQLRDLQIVVDKDHPLFVYLPCGVGGGPGGITFGLKQIFGDNVHCFFAEPTHSPSMLVGLCTGLHDKISISDLGLDNITDADGLAVSRPSQFIGKVMAPLIAGVFTVTDEEMYRLLTLLADCEKIRMEPSALVGMPGIQRILSITKYNFKKNRATHIVWGTGGNMVPDEEMAAYYNKGRQLSNISKKLSEDTFSPDSTLFSKK